MCDHRLLSCLSRGHRRFLGSVRFSSNVVVHGDESLTISGPTVESLHEWPAKTWKFARRGSKRCAQDCQVHALWTLLEPPSEVMVLSRNSKEATDVVVEEQAPLSLEAVLSRSSDTCAAVPCRPVLADVTNLPTRAKFQHHAASNDADQLDRFCLMQRPLVPATSFKTSPHSDAQDDLLQSFAQGHVEAPNFPDVPSSEVPSSSGYSGSVASEVEPAATLEVQANRQEVILYHLNDAPLRVFLDWTTYDSMLTEIAWHFARPVVDVVDAYEVTPHPDDTPPGVVPVIVHMLDDIAMGQQARLALLDVELHGHSFEAHYAIGPSTTRYVVCLPTQCHRSAVLAVADIDRYCRQERDTCLVWHQQVYWPDNDPQPRVLLHGQYFRVAAPPSSRFVCTTQQAVEMAQNQLSEQEMLDRVVGDEVLSEVSPSLLSSPAMRAHARPEDHDTDDDLFQALQLAVKITAPGDVVSSPQMTGDNAYLDVQHCDFQALYPIFSKWVKHTCRTELFQGCASFLTWRLSPATGKRFCNAGRTVVLQSASHQWKSQICDAWSDEQDASASTQIIAVSTDPYDLEPGIAGHIIIQQHALPEHHPVLITTFDSLIQHGRPTRSAQILSINPMPEDVLLYVGYPCPCPSDVRIDVQLYETSLSPGRTFVCSPGDSVAVFIQRLPQTNDSSVYSDLVCHFSQDHCQASMVVERQVPRNNWSHTRVALPVSEILHNTVIFWTKLASDPQISITEEVVQRLRARQEHALADEPAIPPFAPDPTALEMQPIFVQELWAIHQHLLGSGDQHPDTPIRVETWFLDHLTQDRCYMSRIVDLPHDHTQWRQAIAHAWISSIVPNAELEYSHVYPAPVDTNPAVIGQVILTQHPQDEVRSIVLSIYDTARPTPGPFTFALTHGIRITLLSVLEEVRLLQACPPRVQQNECSLWIGNVQFPAPRQAFVRSGNAFQLSIRRGIRFDIPALLSLPDPILRQHLQEAICGEIYHLPHTPHFPSSAMPPVESSGESGPASSSTQLQSAPVHAAQDTRPQWIISLNSFFSLHSATELLEEGPVLYIQVWYVHGSECLWCQVPRPARLQVSLTTWRQAIMQPWQDVLHRSLPLEYWLVHPTPPVGIGGSPVAHIILTQGLVMGQVAVFIAAMPTASDAIRAPSAVYVLPRAITAGTIAQMIIPHEHRHVPFSVEHQGITYDAPDLLHMATGDCLVVTYDLFQDSSADVD